MTASESKLSNLLCIVPKIDLQKRASIVHFWFSMGWQLEEVRFDDVSFIFEGFQRAQKTKDKPVVLLG
jgi:transketolase N-terminal domain/subunit